MNVQRPVRAWRLASGWRCSNCGSLWRSIGSQRHSVRSFKAAPPPTRLSRPARTRFAPSPTGYLHLGSLRTALYGYLLAKSTGGQWILRIEDTDQKRTVADSEAALYNILNWLGLKWDEGPVVGGSAGSYKQSERLPIYKDHAERLLKDGHAYRCFCSQERLQSSAAGRGSFSQAYDRHCLPISPAEADERVAKGESHVIRLKGPKEWPAFVDLVYGPISYGVDQHAMAAGVYEDPIILKSDGMPTYHLASVVDDHYMEISHVIRASEWMPSTPKHMALYSAFGWKPPAWVHLGLLLDKDGKKLSKRLGAQSVEDYRREGYLPQALLNLAVLQGMSHGEKSEVFSLEKMAEVFSLERLTKGNAIVSFEKLDFFQKAHLGSPDKLELSNQALDAIKSWGSEGGVPIAENQTLDRVALTLETTGDRFVTAKSFADQFSYIFYQLGPNDWNNVKQDPLTAIVAQETLAEFKKFPTWKLWQVAEAERQAKESTLKVIPEAAKAVAKKGFYYRALRHILAGGRSGPSTSEIAYLLGRNEAIKRLSQFLRTANKPADAMQDADSIKL